MEDEQEECGHVGLLYEIIYDGCGCCEDTFSPVERNYCPLCGVKLEMEG